MPMSGERARPQPRTAYAWFREVSPQWRDNDVYGHVNNAVHYTWFDSAVNAWLLEQGLLTIGDSDVVGLVVASGCQYFAEVAFPQRVVCGLRVDSIGTSSVRYGLGLFRDQERLSFAAGGLTHVYVAWPSRTPRPLAQRMRASVEKLTGSGRTAPAPC
jgi:acyl-CoA thioester hydrolase